MNNYSLPLFPLNVVVCPGGLMPLRIFEARYLDMVKNCLRNNTSFAIVTVLPEGQTDIDGHFLFANKSPFANVGTLLKITEANVTTVGLMMIRCVGHHRIKVNSFTQQTDGLLIADVTDMANDTELTIPDNLEIASSNLQYLLESLPAQGILPNDIPVIKPYKFDDTGWVANRWIELLDLPLLQKQRLMQLHSPILRLEMIHDILDADLRKSKST